jgi:hypothetical protein
MIIRKAEISDAGKLLEIYAYMDDPCMRHLKLN